MIFDTHCHIYDEMYNDDLDKVLSDAFSNGVKKILVPGNTLEESIKAVELADRYDNLFAAVGVHPSEVFDLDLNSTMETLKQLVKNTKVKAIGEIGLDYHWHKLEEEKAIQREWFKAQLLLAESLKLPVIIHSRDACLDTIQILKECKLTIKVLFHCFSYSVEVMEEIIKYGWYIGLDGPVTYKNAITPKEVASKVPLNKLVLETDCPYLTPTPNRGKRNEPSYITYIAMEVARQRNMAYDDLCNATYKNGCDFFGIDYE